MSDVAHMTEIAEAAAQRAVQKTLLLIGVDVSNPIEAQQEFSTLRDVARMARSSDFRKDLEHARTSRLFWEGLRDKGTLIALGLLISAMLGARAFDFKAFLVGAARFELATPSPPDWCANRAALRSERRGL